jgi:hypothetical protein
MPMSSRRLCSARPGARALKLPNVMIHLPAS